MPEQNGPVMEEVLPQHIVAALHELHDMLPPGGCFSLDFVNVFPALLAGQQPRVELIGTVDIHRVTQKAGITITVPKKKEE